MAFDDQETLSPNEASSLLRQSERVGDPNALASESDEYNNRVTRTATTVLPVALLSALAMAATAATTIYAYADLSCEDPTHCREEEQRRYAGTVAIAVTVANLCALLSLGAIAQIVKKNHRAGLVVWTVCRSMSVASLALGVQVGHIEIAICGQIFEGIASDNILHFCLNALYVQVPRQRTRSQLVGTSLALYMIGISVSPSLAALLRSFQDSFIMAATFFAASLLYLIICVPTPRPVKPQDAGLRRPEPTSHTEHSWWKYFFTVTIEPLYLFAVKPRAMVPALALFLYNLIQSYMLSAIMVFASIEFAFSGRENGYLISIAHAIASMYLLSTILLRSIKTRREKAQVAHSHDKLDPTAKTDVILGVVAVLIQASALALLSLVTEARQIYILVAICALGFSAPSFIKSYFSFLFDESKRPHAMATMAVMETFGGLLGPVLHGGLMALFVTNVKQVFFTASGVLILAALILVLGIPIQEP